MISKNADLYVEPVPPTQPESNLKIRKNLSSLIVFTNSGEELSDVIKDDFCDSSGTNSLPYLSTWFKREASRYGILLSMTVQCYDKQFTLSPDIISTKDTYTAFGQAISVPLDMTKTIDYLFKIVPSLEKYDLVTVIHYRTEGEGVADLAPKKINFVFLTKDKIIDGVQYYNPDINGLLKGIAHESLHNLGALDHYNYNSPGECLTESDPILFYTSRQIMCATAGDFQSFIIPPETAKEIGWLRS